LVALLFETALSSAQSFRWVHSAGGVDEDAGFALAVDAATNVYATGHFAGQSTFGTNVLSSTGALDIFVCKLDAAGNFLWSTRFGGTGDDEGTGIAVDHSGNLHLTGNFATRIGFGRDALLSAGASDVFVAKLDNTGCVLWSARAGGIGRDVANDIASDRPGNSYITGSYQQNAQFGSTNLTGGALPQFFLAKYDPDGTLLWARNTGGGERAVGNSVVADDNGNVWSVGDYYPVTQESLRWNGFIVRYNTSGDAVWYRTFPSDAPDSAQAMSVDAAGNSYVTGYFSGTAKFGGFTLRSRGDRDIFVLKCDAGGQVLWARRAGGASTDLGLCIAVDHEGSSLIGGYFLGTADFGAATLSSNGSADAFVAKLDTDGQVLWAVQAGGSVNMELFGLSLDSGGNAYATGYFRYNTFFGGVFLSNHSSGRDTFFARLDSPPLPRLSIAPSAGSALISWPLNSAGFGLESTTQLGAPDGWKPVTNSPARVGERNVITNSSTDPRRFYRLRK